MCDPQLGMGGYEADVARFKQAVAQINALKPDFVIICGDLVNGAKEDSFSDFNAIKANLSVPCYCAAGNHDVGNTPTAESLRRYRQFIGKDYYAFEHQDFTFVVLNTSLWKAPIAPETEQQESWLRATLEDAAHRHRRIVIVAHYPLFLKISDEADEYFNLPKAKRQELLALFERSGVVAVLTGHTHRLLTNQLRDLQMVSGETTSRNFDQRPFGFRVWHGGPGGLLRNEFVPLREQ
jgi:3',5'-cyclic AMP phosphodiesterase CpdA